MIFGTGGFAECAHFYFTHDSEHTVVAFTASPSRIEQDGLLGLPVVSFDEIESRYPPPEHAMFIAIGYAGLNRVRAQFYEQARSKGYDLVTYVSSRATTWPGLVIGDNSFVFEDNTIQAYATIGRDVVLWSGNHIGHHSVIGDHCFITSHVVISGYVDVGPYSFIGVNATVRDGISIGAENVIGAGAVIMKKTEAREVYIQPRTTADPRTSDSLSF